MDLTDYNSILEASYNSANNEFKKDVGVSFFSSLSPSQKKWIMCVFKYIEDYKGVLAVLITSLVKKIADPSQDIRSHMEKLPNGYSGRTLDTRFITPFLKKHFTRFAMSESGWLTRSLEQSQPYDSKYPGAIRNTKVKDAFLQILNDLQSNHTDPKSYLVAMFIELLRKVSDENSYMEKYEVTEETVTITEIINLLKQHFFAKYKGYGASRLPVIAIYSIYQILMNDVDRYKGKKLLELRSHLSSDIKSHGIGDVEIVDEDGNYFEAVEIKHEKPVDEVMINDSFKKFKFIAVKRFYILTTSDPNIAEGHEEAVNLKIREIKKENGCEVIANGLISSIKYYLRMTNEPGKFLSVYTKNLKNEFQKNTEIKEEHVKKWDEIMNQFKGKNDDSA